MNRQTKFYQQTTISSIYQHCESTWSVDNAVFQVARCKALINAQPEIYIARGYSLLGWNIADNTSSTVGSNPQFIHSWKELNVSYHNPSHCNSIAPESSLFYN